MNQLAAEITRPVGRPRPPMMACLLFLSAVTGCQISPEVTALQQESRQQQTTIRSLKDELKQTQEQLISQDLELQNLRDRRSDNSIHSVSSNRTSSAAVEQSSLWASVASVRIHRLTSGVRNDNGALTLRLVVQPLDSDGEVIKVPGELELVVQSENASPINKRWSLTESRSLWQWNLVSTGFVLELPLESGLSPDQPLSCKVTYRLSKQRQFQADTTIPIQNL